MHNSHSKFDVFISYSHQDSPLVHKVADELEKNGIRVWIDREGVCYTHAIKRRLVEGILSSRCVLYFSSNNSNRSDWSYKEISFASRKKKPILPIRIDNSPYHEVVEFDINDITYLDYTDPSKREEKFNELLDYLQKGTPLHPKESKRSFVDNLKKAWKTLKEDSGKRSRFVNLLLIAIQVLGMIALVLLGGASIDRSITRFVSAPLDSIADIYGKGFIPGLLLSLIIVICNGLILWNRKKGIYILIIAFFLITLPTIWNMFEEFVYFSVFCLLGILVYWLVLLIPFKKNSAWKHCRDCSSRLRLCSYFALSIWVLVLVALPPFMAKTIGFQDNLYRNGMLVIDAKANHGAIRLAHTIAFGNDMNKDMNKYRRWMIADGWYRQAISELPRVNSLFAREYRLEYYIDYICFCVKCSHYEMAKELMDQLKKEYNDSEIQKGLEVDYIIPYRQSILDLLKSEVI